MMHSTFGWGTMMFGGLGMLTLWALVIGLVYWFMRNFAADRENSTPQSSRTWRTPLEILQGRYASGEITREEYETMYRELNNT